MIKAITQVLQKILKKESKTTTGMRLLIAKVKPPFELVWFCSFKDKKKALDLDFEKYLKQGSGFAFARKRLV